MRRSAMQYQILGLMGAISLILIFLALWKRLQVFGVIAGILIIISGFWILSSGIEYVAGSTTTYASVTNQMGYVNGTTNITGNVTNSTIYDLLLISHQVPELQNVQAASQTTTEQYAMITGLVGQDTSVFFAILFALLGAATIIWFGTTIR
jgi:hypothetical protein